MTDRSRLNETFGKSEAVTFFDSNLGGLAVELKTPQAIATVALHGAHVLDFRPKDAKEVLWMSPSARIAEGQGIRGGIPVCWPWFAAHATDPSKPDHGFVRKTSWEVVRTWHSGETGIELMFPFTEQVTSLWSGRADLRVNVSLTDKLTVELVTTNAGPEPIALTQALHTYFAVAEISQTSVHGLEDVAYLDKLQDYRRLRQQGPIRFAGEVDRIYESTQDDVVIADPGNARNIRVAKAGSHSTVVWNPWIEKSARLSDMPPDSYRGMVCVETTNAGGDVVTLAPRNTHRLATTISVEPL